MSITPAAPLPTGKAVAGVPIRLRAVEKTFPAGVQAVDHVTLDIPAGQFLAMIGPSGCGKSTLLRMIAGLDHPTGGEIDLPTHSCMAYVFQDAHLLPWRNVLGNVALPLELAGMPRGERLDRAAAAVAAVGLTEFARRHPAELSGGMRMRVSLARALVTEPRVLLLDEPFAALDEITRQQLDDQLRALWAGRRMTVLFVTHSIMEATYLAERAVVLSRRPARVVVDTTLDLPAERHPDLRGRPEFAREMARLFDALQRGGGTVEA
jgi:NitT/TauT family transport system ATP-binding protein